MGRTIAFVKVARVVDMDSGDPDAPGRRPRDRLPDSGGTAAMRCAPALLLVLPGALTVYLAVNSGGMYPITAALASLTLVAAMLIALAFAGGPLKPSRASLLPAGLLALFAAWTLVSSAWSHAPGRAEEAFVRVLLYLLVFTLFALVPYSATRMGLLLRGVLLGIVVVALLALISRLIPGVILVHPALEDQRLSYPVTYWNTLGMILGIGLILAVHHSSDESQPGAVRALAAGCLPLLASALLLTFSRGAIAAGAIGLVVYLIVARPRGALGGLLAGAPFVAVALTLTDHATLLQQGSPWTAAQIAQGQRLAIELVSCSLAAAATRLMLLPLDARMRLSTPRLPAAAWSKAALGVLGALVLIGGALALHAPSLLRTQYEHFVEDRQPRGESSQRLLYVGNDGRLPLWRVAVAAYRKDPLLGTGAGTYRLDWERRQQGSFDRVYAYSLYLEALAELGLVGMALLGGALLAMLAGVAMRAGKSSAYAAALATLVAWMVHAGVDLDWQTPVVTLPVIAIAGAALARPASASAGPGRSPGRRRTSANPLARAPLALLCVLAAVVPVKVAIAQSDTHIAVKALGDGDCARASEQASAAISAGGAGATPYIVLAMCAGRAGHYARALRWARAAVAKDSGNWQTHYALALVQGVAGIDPEPQARIARVDYPREPQTALAVAAFSARSVTRWRRLAPALPLTLEE